MSMTVADCPNCGAALQLNTKIEQLEISGLANMKLARVACACGASVDVHAAPGTYQLVEGRLRRIVDLLASSDRSSLEQLHSDLHRARAASDAEQARQILEHLGLASPTGDGRSMTLTEQRLWQFVTLLVALIALVYTIKASTGSDDSLSPADVTRIVHNATAVTQPSSPITGKRLCPCGSGKQFKRCHGARENRKQ